MSFFPPTKCVFVVLLFFATVLVSGCQGPGSSTAIRGSGRVVPDESFDLEASMAGLLMQWAGQLLAKGQPEDPALLAGQMEQLAKALELNKSAMSLSMSNLANLKMIDAATLAKMQAAAGNPHPADFAGLAMYLSQCKGVNCNSEVLFSWLRKRGRGGPGGGGPEAPMDWDNDTSEANLKFQAHALPPSAHLSDAQTVGISKAAPELAKNDVAVQSGALDNAVASGGSAHTQVILPEHRHAVQKFFKREEK